MAMCLLFNRCDIYIGVACCLYKYLFHINNSLRHATLILIQKCNYCKQVRPSVRKLAALAVRCWEICMKPVSWHSGSVIYRRA